MEKRNFESVWTLLGSFANQCRDRFGSFDVHIYADCLEVYFNNLPVVKEIPDFSQDSFRVFSIDAGVVTMVLTYEFDSVL